MAISGVSVGLLVVSIFFFLASESRYAFERKFPYGYRIALQSKSAPSSDPVEMDPNASIITAHMDGQDGLDDKESLAMPTLADLAGVATTGTGSPLVSDLNKVDGNQLTRDDWRAWKGASQGDKFLLFAFGTPELKEDKVKIRWEPDASFDPNLSVHRISLKLIQSPPGLTVPSVNVDLIARPSGEIELPSWRAKSDAERTKGYVFEIVAEPRAMSGLTATLGGFFKSEWSPTSQYPKFGFLALLFSTLAITGLAILLAFVPSIFAAIYLSELAPRRLREWLKPAIELLASIPTVVLGYFGLMLVAPGLVSVFGKALAFESGRCVLTASIMMAILIMPTIVSIAEDTLGNLPNSLRQGAEALGLTTMEAVKRVILPAAKPGLIGAGMLGFGRALGETMIVWILAGGTPLMPPLSLRGLVSPVRGVADTIGLEMANVEFEKPHYGHLFLIGLVLFALTISINLYAQRLSRRAMCQHS